jgi:Phospholipase_D-nuclease N-terminal
MPGVTLFAKSWLQPGPNQNITTMTIAFLFFVVFLVVGLTATAFWLWMLIDCIMSTTINGTEKIVWLLVIIFTHFIGALIYFLVKRSARMG